MLNTKTIIDVMTAMPDTEKKTTPGGGSKDI